MADRIMCSNSGCLRMGGGVAYIAAVIRRVWNPLEQTPWERTMMLGSEGPPSPSSMSTFENLTLTKDMSPIFSGGMKISR